MERFGFCRVTQHGLLRTLTNKASMNGDPRRPEDAWEIYDHWRVVTGASFQPEPPGLEASWRLATKRYFERGSHWTDAYLWAFAAATGFSVATLDRSFYRPPGAAIEVISG